jgi:DNA repair protein RecO (recombination protein O)
MYYQIKGLVLNSYAVGEADKVANVFSYEWGKVSIFFPGAKKINAKLASSAEPLTESEFMVYQRHPSMQLRATGARILNNYSHLKIDFVKNAYALYACEIVMKLAPYNIANPQKYTLLARIWEVIGSCKNTRLAVLAFVLRFLKLSGYSFDEYIANNLSAFDPHIQKMIRRLSRCAGDDIDEINIDPIDIWDTVENYLLIYTKRPSVSVFFTKMKKE